eukprot:5442034-Pyramimonas_sp.AAC.2
MSTRLLCTAAIRGTLTVYALSPRLIGPLYRYIPSPLTRLVGLPCSWGRDGRLVTSSSVAQAAGGYASERCTDAEVY